LGAVAPAGTRARQSAIRPGFSLFRAGRRDGPRLGLRLGVVAVAGCRRPRGQMDVLAAAVAAGGSVQDAADLVGIRPSTVKRHLADLRARSGLTTEQLIYRGCAEGWPLVPSLEPS
jgi:hypothetical protein